MNTIEDFIKNYRREADFYENLAALVEARCREACDSAGIKAIFSHRAKAWDSLLEKLKRREGKRGSLYKSAQEIREDIVDLAGVRIALYLPDDKRRMKSLIEQNFDIVEFKEKTSEEGKYKFPGYQADHYHIRLPGSVQKKNSKYYGQMVEIQVASVFMHAWSEVEHGLGYKNSTSNSLSKAEILILDQLNGLAHAAEFALIQLKRAILARTNQADNTFRNHYELTAFVLDEVIRKRPEQPVPKTGGMDILYDFIRRANLLDAESVRKLIERLTFDDDKPIAGVITDELLKEHPEWENFYRQAHFNVNNPYPDHYYVEPGIFSREELSPSCLIKGNGGHIYWYSRGEKRFVIPNKQTFDTWYPTSGPKPRVKRIQDEELVKIPIGGNVTYRPGTRLIKIATDPKVYAVGHGGVIRWLSNERVAEDLFGLDWRVSLVDSISDAFFINYSVGYRIDTTKDYNAELERAAAKTIDEDMAETELPVSVAQRITRV